MVRRKSRQAVSCSNPAGRVQAAASAKIARATFTVEARAPTTGPCISGRRPGRPSRRIDAVPAAAPRHARSRPGTDRCPHPADFSCEPRNARSHPARRRSCPGQMSAPRGSGNYAWNLSQASVGPYGDVARFALQAPAGALGSSTQRTSTRSTTQA